MSKAQPKKDNTRSRSDRGILQFSLILIIGLIIGLVAILPQFYIARIEVKGERRLSEATIIRSSGIEQGKHILLYVSGDFTDVLRLRYGDVEERLLAAYPYLAEVSVRVSFPYKVNIDVVERIEVAYLKTAADYVAVDSQGTILERLPLDVTLETPVIRGLAADELIPGERISEESKRAVDRTLLAINAILRADRDAADEFSLMDQISSFYPYSANALYITMNDKQGTPLQVKLNPAQNAETKVLWLRNALEQGALEELGKGVLDLSGGQNIFSPSLTVPAVTGTTTAQKETESVSTETQNTEAAAPPATTAAETATTTDENASDTVSTTSAVSEDAG